MNPSDDFQRKIDSLLAVQAEHDGQIQALIRVAELQQTNLDRLDETVADLAQSVTKDHSELVARQKESGERIDRLVSAIGEFVRKSN